MQLFGVYSDYSLWVWIRLMAVPNLLIIINVSIRVTFWLYNKNEAWIITLSANRDLGELDSWLIHDWIQHWCTMHTIICRSRLHFKFSWTHSFQESIDIRWCLVFYWAKTGWTVSCYILLLLCLFCYTTLCLKSWQSNVPTPCQTHKYTYNRTNLEEDN